MSVLWSAVNLSPNDFAGGRPSGSGSVPALQGALVIFVILHISQSGSAGKCVYGLCLALGALVYFDFTKRCFFRFLTLVLEEVSGADDDLVDVVVEDSWLVEGEGDRSWSPRAAVEDRSSHSIAQDRSWQEFDEVETEVDSSEISPWCAAKIIGTSWCGVNVMLVDPFDIVGCSPSFHS